MGPITQRLIELAGGDFRLQAEVSDPSGNWHMFNDGGIECETGELLYAFIRETKPKHVLETGTHRAVGAGYMGLAMKDNGYGELDTVEFLPPHYIYSLELIQRMQLDEHVHCHHTDVAEFNPQHQYQLMLLDTEPQTRFAELIRFERFLEPGGFIFIHDLHRHMHQIPNEEHGFAWPYGKLPKEIIKLVKDDVLRPFHFGTPRGLTGFYKPTDGDFKWK